MSLAHGFLGRNAVFWVCTIWHTKKCHNSASPNKMEKHFEKKHTHVSHCSSFRPSPFSMQRFQDHALSRFEHLPRQQRYKAVQRIEDAEESRDDHQSRDHRQGIRIRRSLPRPTKEGCKGEMDDGCTHSDAWWSYVGSRTDPNNGCWNTETSIQDLVQRLQEFPWDFHNPSEPSNWERKKPKELHPLRPTIVKPCIRWTSNLSD